MPRSSQPLDTPPIVNNSQIRIGYEIIHENQQVGSILISGSVAMDNIKFESNQSLLECLKLSDSKPPNILDISQIQPQFSS